MVGCFRPAEEAGGEGGFWLPTGSQTPLSGMPTRKALTIPIQKALSCTMTTIFSANEFFF